MSRTRTKRSAGKSAARPQRRQQNIATPLQPDMPDDVRRRDQEVIASDSLPRPDEDASTAASGRSEDGNVEQHPIHDSDIEDAGPEDFEDLVNEAERGGFDSTAEEEIDLVTERERRRRE